MARQGIKRKLDAILVADVVGFSRLTEADEAVTRMSVVWRKPDVNQKRRDFAS